MNKSLVICAGVCAVLAFSSCSGTKESAYRKAYDKAVAQGQVGQAASQDNYEAPAVTPLETRPATQTTVTDNVDNAVFRQESLTVVNGSGLRAFSVVVGSFSVKANAEGLQQTLKNAGYDAQVAYNSARNMYRVVASTFDNKVAAVNSRDALRNNYPDAWLLYNK